MNIKRLIKQTYEFERKVLQLDAANDSFSDADIQCLDAKLQSMEQAIKFQKQK